MPITVTTPLYPCPTGTTPFPAAQHTQLAELASVLQAMTKAVCLLGLLAITLGPPYSYTALRLVYGTKWSESEAPRVLAAYCPYILLLALNGKQRCVLTSCRDVASRFV